MRVVFRPPWPGGWVTVVPRGSSGTRVPSTVSDQAVELAARVRVPLQRRDLGRVDDVAHVDVVALHVDLGQVVDAEVAERVRAGRGRKQEEGGEGDGEEAHDHPCASETPMVLRLAAGRLQQDVRLHDSQRRRRQGPLRRQRRSGRVSPPHGRARRRAGRGHADPRPAPFGLRAGHRALPRRDRGGLHRRPRDADVPGGRRRPRA